MLGLELKIGSNIVGAKLGNRCITITIDKIGNDFFLKYMDNLEAKIRDLEKEFDEL